MHRNSYLNRLIAAFVFSVAFVILMSVPLRAQEASFSEGFEYKEYVVKKGDTLWSISKRELEDAFQWPLVWRENLRINNPDLISPGQVIIIPIRALDKKPMMPEEMVVIERDEGEEVAGEAVMPGEELPGQEGMENVPEGAARIKKLEREGIEPLVSRELLLASGYITKVIPDAGEVTGNAYDRLTYAMEDEIYIRTKVPAVVGQKFYVVRKEAEVTHPVGKQRIGWLVKVAGVIETIEAGKKGLRARVLETFDYMEKGDSLDYYFDISAPFVVGPPRRPFVEGYVIASNYMRLINAAHDIVFIDKGEEDGLRLGDVLMTLIQGTDDKMSAVLQLVNVRKKTALAIILKSEYAVSRGDIFTGLR